LVQAFKMRDPSADAHDVEIGMALVQRIGAGDAAALEELYRRHGRELFVFIYRRLRDEQLAEETLQDVMLGVWNGARRFRGDASVRTWLFAIAHQRTLRAVKKLPAAGALESNPDELASASPGPREWTETRRRADAVRAALAELPAHQRAVVELIYLHGLTGPEVSRVLGVPIGTVKSRQNRALRALAALLAEVAE